MHLTPENCIGLAELLFYGCVVCQNKTAMMTCWPGAVFFSVKSDAIDALHQPLVVSNLMWLCLRTNLTPHRSRTTSETWQNRSKAHVAHCCSFETHGVPHENVASFWAPSVRPGSDSCGAQKRPVVNRSPVTRPTPAGALLVTSASLRCRDALLTHTWPFP